METGISHCQWENYDRRETMRRRGQGFANRQKSFEVCRQHRQRHG